ncbi:hypothetical protein EDD22DRAFT_617779 [Suillus occidentalis]|nr:hypothetical protein EDD22DRAFT_617779 [Suillus occidentalis]
MSSLNGGYDQNLLDEAPAATRAQRQEGYKVDLLDDRPTRPASTQPLKPPQPIPSDPDIESSSLTQEKVPGVATYASRPTQSFWRTRNGKIAIFVIAIVVIGTVVGGAVGGTVGKIGSNNNTPPQNAATGSFTTSDTSTGTDSSTPTSNKTGVTPTTPTSSSSSTPPPTGGGVSPGTLPTTG